MRKITVLSLMILSLLSCKNDKSEKIAIGSIISITSLNEISLGQSDSISISFGGGDGCSSPDHLEAIQTDSTIIFKAYYKYPAKEQICPHNLPVHHLIYVFKPKTKGNYTYKSYDSDINATTIVK